LASVPQRRGLVSGFWARRPPV